MVREATTEVLGKVVPIYHVGEKRKITSSKTIWERYQDTVSKKTLLTLSKSIKPTNWKKKKKPNKEKMNRKTNPQIKHPPCPNPIVFVWFIL